MTVYLTLILQNLTVCGLKLSSTSVTMDMSMRKQITQQMAATTSLRREPRGDVGGSMSMIPVIKPSTPTNWRQSRDGERRQKWVTATNKGTKLEWMAVLAPYAKIFAL